MRKSGDGLYYILKQLMLMKKANIPVKPEWEKGTLTVANSFVKLWKKWGQYGNFIDSKTGDIVVGGSTSGAILPAALVLACEYYGDATFLEIAQASAEYFYNNFVKKASPAVDRAMPCKILTVNHPMLYSNRLCCFTKKHWIKNG
ncbi:MAG: hypothetical protein HC830_02070 [Bacteroidetes bacterium]|nr:hypothetical protein [Bacteroidota bacterium]